MSRVVGVLLAVVVGALTLAAGASSRLVDADLTVPILLQPAANQSFPAGTSIVFQIQTHPGDGYLWLHVSKSPAVVDPCGTIGEDVELESFAVSSADPSIYEAAPTHYSGDWMDTPGTYYWQAHRIEYADGADGCIESEVRSFTITKPLPKSLAAARLEGTFKIKLTVRSTSGIKSVKRGRTYTEQWEFTPRCAKGACRTNVSVSSLYSTIGGWNLLFKRSGRLYQQAQRATLLQCFYRPVRGPLSVSVRVTGGAWVGTAWRATKITGTFRHSVSSTRSGIYRCPAGTLNATLRGTLSE